MDMDSSISGRLFGSKWKMLSKLFYIQSEGALISSANVFFMLLCQECVVLSCLIRRVNIVLCLKDSGTRLAVVGVFYNVVL